MAATGIDTEARHWFTGAMPQRQTPLPRSNATMRSRAAGVSAHLRRHGYRPLPSGSPRDGLIRVRPSVDDVLVSVDLTLHGPTSNAKMLAELTETLGLVYTITDTHTEPDRITFIYITRKGW